MVKRAFIFDDEPLTLNILENILCERGFQVFPFSDPSQCGLLNSSLCPCKKQCQCTDILITDLKMPNKNGIRFIQNLRENGCGLENIAIISAYWDKLSRVIAAHLGCKTFDKPFSIENLMEWMDICERNITSDRIIIDLPSIGPSSSGIHKGYMLEDGDMKTGKVTPKAHKQQVYRMKDS